MLQTPIECRPQQFLGSRSHGFFNKHPWQTLTLIAADRFLVEQDLLKGEPTFAAPSTGEKLVKWKSERKNRTGSAWNSFSPTTGCRRISYTLAD
jgi:hypothetical protein